jgi:hypothetical protein
LACFFFALEPARRLQLYANFVQELSIGVPKLGFERCATGILGAAV